MHCTEATEASKPWIAVWADHVTDLGPGMGFDFHAPKKFESMLADAGFTNIKVQWQSWPFGTWAKGAKNKRIGQWYRIDAQDPRISFRNAADHLAYVGGR
jgi:hypothetical protein